MNMERWLSPAEAGKRLGCSSQNVVRLCKNGTLRFVWTQLGRLIDPESVEALICERRDAAGMPL